MAHEADRVDMGSAGEYERATPAQRTGISTPKNGQSRVMSPAVRFPLHPHPERRPCMLTWLARLLLLNTTARVYRIPGYAIALHWHRTHGR
jgi:hypothetical protein